MKIIDTYSDIVSLVDKMNGDFDIALWEIYINQISKELLQKVKEDSYSYDFNQELLPVLRYTINNREKLKLLHNSFLATTKDLDKRLTEVLGVDLQVNIILYLGLCNGAGWATELEGESGILLGVEKIIELNWCDYQGYSDTGYFIGGEFVKQLAKKYTLKELANLNIQTIYEEFYSYATQTLSSL